MTRRLVTKTCKGCGVVFEQRRDKNGYCGQPCWREWVRLQEPRACRLDGCTSKVHSRDLCEVHYRRFMRLGTTEIKTKEQKFWEYVLKTEPEACWFWQGSFYSTGYGRYGYKRKRVMAHRFSYTQEVGEIPRELVIDHLCRNIACVNPAHLEVVTNQENVARGVWKSKTSGLPPGVYKNGKKFIALKRFNGLQQVYISTFETVDDAKVAYETAIGVLV